METEKKFHRVRVLHPVQRQKKLYQPGEVFVASEEEIEGFKQNLKGAAKELAPHEVGDRMLFEVLPD